MDGVTSGGLWAAALVVLAFTAFWAAVSIPAFIVKQVTDRFGVPTLAAKAAALARSHGHLGPALATFFERVRSSAHDDVGAIRVFLDTRHRQLRQAMEQARLAIKQSTQALDGLSDDKGLKNILGELSAMKEETRGAAEFGGGYVDELDEEYPARSNALFNIVLLGLGALLMMIVNGGFLSLFFDGYLAGRVFGVKTSILFGAAVVIIEFFVGYALAETKPDEERPPNRLSWYFLLFIVLCAMVAEAIILGIVSYESEIPALQDYPPLQYFLGIFGIVFVAATTATGLNLHRYISKWQALRGRRRLKKELAAINDYVGKLPARWGAIAKAARDAELSVGEYAASLGAGAEVVDDAIAGIKSERDAVTAALRDARIEAWPSFVEAGEADRRYAMAQNLALFLYSVAAAFIYAFFVHVAAGPALEPRFGEAAPLAAAMAVTAAFYFIGFLPFGRVQTGQGGSGRVFPLRPGPSEYGAAAAVVVVLTGCLMWMTWSAGTPLGAVAGLLLAACSIFVVGAGYFADRAIRGAQQLATLFVALLVGVVAGLFAFLRYLVLWIAAGLAWLLNLAIAILAAPLTLLLQALGEASKQKPAALAPSAA